MKYINFKRYKFVTIFNNINLKKYILSRFYKLVMIFKNIKPKKHDLSRFYKFLNFKRYNFSEFNRNLNLRKYNISKIYRYLDLKRYKYIPIYFASFAVLSATIYLSIPLFFKYDKSNIKNLICKDFHIKCTIKGKVNYSFFPSPRIKLKNLLIEDIDGKSKNSAKVENIAITLSIYNLWDKKKFNFIKIKMKDVKIDLDLENFYQYKNIYQNKTDFIPINLKNGEINFFEKNKYITSIKDINFKYKLSKNGNRAVLKGIFLNDNLYIKFRNKKNDKNISKTVILKLFNSQILTKVNIFNSPLGNKNIDGNIFFKKNRNKLTGIFNYKNDKITLKKANIRNSFLDGKLIGEIQFLPYFSFDLDLDLNSINFSKINTLLTGLSEKEEKKLFKINKKINGRIYLSADKIYSKSNLINSLETRIKFINGNISVEQLLLNLGKLGAADITGLIENNKQFTNFKFENNIFFDNLKRVNNKFGLFNKKNSYSDFFISGNFDLVNLNMHFYEIFNDKKFKNEDMVYIEQEFNNLLLEDGYASLFNFVKFKEFIKLVTTEIN